MAVKLVGDAAEWTCDPEGEMLWDKNLDGSDSFSMCYAPSLVGGNLGPTGGRLQCDRNSFFFVEAPKFCCKNPRLDLNGKTVKGKGKVCGDVLATFDSDAQLLKFERGPAKSATQEQLDELWGNGGGDSVPSTIGLNAVKDGEDWQNVLKVKCKGDRGTLIKWKRGNKAEFCPTGTTPILGHGYMSFSCDGFATDEAKMYCCKVNGELHCARSLYDANPLKTSCECQQNSFAKPSAQPAEDKAAAAAAVVPAESSGQGVLFFALAGCPKTGEPRRGANVPRRGRSFL